MSETNLVSETHVTKRAAATGADIPDWLMAQSEADVEELICALSELERSNRALPRLRRACGKLSQDVRYMREICSMAQRTVRP